MSNISVNNALDNERYGWSSPQAAYSVNYVWPAILAELQQAKASKVLDLGCGNGAMTRLLLQNGFAVVGFEPDEEGLNIARRDLPKVQFEKVGVYDDPKDWKQQFDAVVSSEVIEHLVMPNYLVTFAKEATSPASQTYE